MSFTRIRSQFPPKQSSMIPPYLAELATIVAPQAELNAQRRRTIGLDVLQVQHMSPETLVQFLQTGAGLCHGRAIFLAVATLARSCA